MEENTLSNLANASLGRLSSELDELLRSRARLRRLVKRESLYTFGSPPDAIFCVKCGLVRLSVTAANGREAVLSVVQAGHWFGEVSLFSEAPRVHNATALAASDLWVLPTADFHDIVDRNPVFLREFLRLVSDRYKSALQRVDSIILFPFPVRLARRLMAVMDAKDAVSSDDDAVLKLSQENLGQMLGVARQSVNRQLKEWESQGILHLEYGRIVIDDKVMLQQLADAGDE